LIAGLCSGLGGLLLWRTEGEVKVIMGRVGSIIGQQNRMNETAAILHAVTNDITGAESAKQLTELRTRLSDLAAAHADSSTSQQEAVRAAAAHEHHTFGRD